MRRVPRVKRARAIVAAIPLSVLVVTALWGCLLLGASVVWPMSYGGDEPQQIDMAYDYSVHPFHFYGPGQLPLTKADVGMQESLPGYPPNVRLALAPILPRSQRLSFAQLGGHAFITGGEPNQMVQHPPLYFWLEAIVLRVPGVSHLAWDLEVWLMRLLSVVLMLPLPILCWATTRRLLVGSGIIRSPNTASGLAVLAAVIPLTVPNLLRDGSSVDNDTLLILTISLVLYFISRVLTGDRSQRTAIGISVSLAAALWTKGFALVLPPVVLVAYLIGARRIRSASGKRRLVPWRPLAIAAIGGVVGGLWWLRNVIDYGTVQVNGFGPGYDRVIYGLPDNRGTLARFIPEFTTDFIARIWGQVGLPDTPSPGPFIIYGWFFVVLLGFVAALVVRNRPGGRATLLVLAAVPALIALVVASGSYATFRHWSHGTHGSQGRYLFPAMAAIAALSAIGWCQLIQPRFRALLSPFVVVGALFTNAAVWLLILRSWYESTTAGSGFEGLRYALDSLLRWSPLPWVLTILLVIVLPTVSGIMCLVVVARDALRLRQTDDAEMLDALASRGL